MWSKENKSHIQSRTVCCCCTNGYAFVITKCQVKKNTHTHTKQTGWPNELGLSPVIGDRGIQTSWIQTQDESNQ